jgi:hypothetical protein
VGDFRDKKGFYRNFIGTTVKLFESCGAHFYNESILLDVMGTAQIRASAVFNATRKLTKVHQNVLIFVKGDPKKATQHIKDSNA